MTVVISTNTDSRLVAKPREPSKLTIIKNENHGQYRPKYSYTFSTTEFIVTDRTNPDLIVLELDMDQRPESLAGMYIHDFCCTRGNSMKAEEFWNGQGKQEQGFGQNTIRVGFKPQLISRELVSVGLLVAIIEHDATAPELILCDPQVGNGPPVLREDGFVIYPAIQIA